MMDEVTKPSVADPVLAAEAELQEEQESLIEYPCDFPIKVVGLNTANFVNGVAQLAQQHDPEFTSACLQTRHSTAQKYIGITLMIRATSREQLDGLYRALQGLEEVKYVL